MSTLYLVATPIGNLGDITLRALEVLRRVDVIAAEDTRKTAILLRHYDIHKPQLAFYEHNEERAGRHIEALLKQGKSVALVTSAGTPGISDPGYTLVQRAIQAGIPVTMIPGPAAFVMALVLSGLPVHSFTFRGFPPRKAGRRRRFLEADRHSPYTLIYYESPYRLVALLRDALEVFGDRPAALANELTKLFEKVYRGTLSSLLETMTQEKPRGEYVLVVAGASQESGVGAHEGLAWEESSPEVEGDETEAEAEEG
ncbi:16S rRNA (cytidine(1402)-2'-O)-methyltransferase [Thermogemmatispora sp.]|uniref:16S rRNA (cytidine(1402)-2'-O)-methyltransferase n=1 Tax=Thermogemmatispora sp. TaxID=1968838 RepID=UPI001D837136|nr:16S rRNA (cytidine(1402)-2'-O)-methyltransferase [Thermogemmatispora sp.]MBX5452259.1 16S rRNA (cytidine(1402)-2'-O)-methyltransferase [Thermogemmatispora sp.]